MGWILGILIFVAVSYFWLRGDPNQSELAVDDDETAPPDDLPDAPLGDMIDLHGLPPAEAGPLVDAYVEEAQRNGFPMVKIIHGRGIGAMRQTVRTHLERSPYVLRFQDAPPPSGRGATIAQLKPQQDDIATQPDKH